MSQSIVAFADLTSIVRAGNITAPAVDSGTDFNINLTGSLPGGLYFPGTTVIGAANSAPFYGIAAVVDWAHLVVQIPSGARITKIRMVCTANASVNGSISANGTVAGNTYIGVAASSAILSVQAPSTAYAHTAHNDLNVSNSQTQNVANAIINISSTVLQADMFVDKTWDFGILLPSGLPYITDLQLKSSFTNVKIHFESATTPGIGGANVNNFWFKASGAGADLTGTETGVVSAQTSIWEMIIDFEEPWSITSITPDPLTVPPNPATITITGINLDLMPIDDVDLTYPDADGNPQDIKPDSVTLIGTTTIIIVVTMPPIPPNPGDDGIDITIYSGSVPVGTITFYYSSGSGIYTIVKDKRNDTLYTNVGDATEDTAIPEPFGETGFIGG